LVIWHFITNYWGEGIVDTGQQVGETNYDYRIYEDSEAAQFMMMMTTHISVVSVNI
jgi:hypothetical protein